MKTTSGKDSEETPQDEREDGSEITLITDTLQLSGKLKMTDSNIQRNSVDQGYDDNQELSEDSPEVLRQKVMSPSLTDVRETLYIRFSKLKPKEFKGTTDLYEAEDWLSSTQAILEATELSNREKIQCATCMLKKEARYWWRTVKERIDVSTMTWEEFVTEFNLKYFNSEMVIAQQTEFHNLKPGRMTVAETVRKLRDWKDYVSFSKSVKKKESAECWRCFALK